MSTIPPGGYIHHFLPLTASTILSFPLPLSLYLHLDRSVPCSEQLSLLVDDEQPHVPAARPAALLGAKGSYMDPLHRKFLPHMSKCLVWYDHTNVYCHETR
jgi:hypothetical protein